MSEVVRRTTGMSIEVVLKLNWFTCGDEALLFSSSFTLNVAVVAVAALSARNGSSWGAVERGSETTTTGLIALSASPLCECGMSCMWRGAGGDGACWKIQLLI